MGHLTDSLWFKFDMKFWTFRVNSDNVILVENVEIQAARSEAVKGLTFSNNKNVKYPPVKVHEKFPHLVAYQIYNCSLKDVRYENFENLTDLQAVYLGYNVLTAIPVDIFKDLSKLKFLSLQGNHLHSIHEDVFKNLINLRELFLNHNHIHLLPPNIFENLRELRNISLTDNKIELLTDEHFRNNGQMENIFLHSNKIKELDSKMFDHMRNLKVVHLKGNVCVNEDFFIETDSCEKRLDEIKARIFEKCSEEK